MSATAGNIAVVGTFDGVHRGHQFLLRQLCSRGAATGLSPIVVTFDRHPLSVVRPDAAPKLLTTTAERLSLLREAAPLDDVVLLHFDDALRALSAGDFMAMLRDRHQVSSMLLGFNHRFGSDRITDFADYRRIANDLGVDIELAPEYRPDGSAPISSTAIRKALLDGDPAAAATALGRSYSISGTVGQGKQLGRTIGFPTANLVDINPDKIIPATGVYAATALLDNRRWQAVVNIGRRPTVDNSENARVSIEAHILGFDGDIYSAPLTLSFDRLIRRERRFPSLDALRHQIAADIASI